MKNILAVDDSPSMREMVSLALKAAGFDVTSAGDGEEAAEDRPPLEAAASHDVGASRPKKRATSRLSQRRDPNSAIDSTVTTVP